MAIFLLTFAIVGVAGLGLWLHERRCGGSCADCPGAARCLTRGDAEDAR